MSEKRSDSRITVMMRVELLWQDGAGTAHITTGTLEDKSREGASVRVKEPIPTGAKLIIQGQRDHFSGTVVYCREDSSRHDRYVLGIQREPIHSPNPT